MAHNTSNKAKPPAQEQSAENDVLIAEKLAGILSGGRLTGEQTVSEQYLLDLERDHTNRSEHIAFQQVLLAAADLTPAWACTSS